MERSIEERVKRLEVLEGLASPPKEWNITPTRVKNLRAKKGIGLTSAREILITGFGEPLKIDEEYY